jgi:hypothetical protein
MTNNFVITGMPRMRSAWFAAYLTQGDVLCYHEAIHSEETLQTAGYSHVGTADSGYILSPDWIEAAPAHKLVIVHRPVDDVVRSLKGIGQSDTRWLLEAMGPKLRQLEGLHIEFDDINDKLEDIHDYLGLPGYDEERADLFANLNVQSQDWR